MNTFRTWWVVLMDGWGRRRQRLRTTCVEMFMVLHPSCLSTLVHGKNRVETDVYFRRCVICFSTSYPQLSTRGSCPWNRQEVAGWMFIRLWRLGPEQSRTLCPCWGGICVSGPEHTSLSLSYRSPHVPLLHMFTLKRSPNCLWVRLFFHRRSPPSPLSAK